MPTIGIVVPTLGERANWLQESLASITSQGLDVRVRVVAPSSAPLAQVLSSNPRVELVSCDEPGLSHAINVGMAAFLERDSEIEHVGWLGDDDLLAPCALDVASRALGRSAAAPFVYGNCRYIDENGRTTMMFRPGPWGAWWSRYGSDLIPQPGSLIRRQAWQHVGGLDESYRHAMDLDLFLRLAELGRPAYVARELASFRVHGGAITSTKPDRSESVRAQTEHAIRQGGSRRSVRWSVEKADRVLLGVMRRLPAPRAESEKSAEAVNAH